MRLLVVWRGWGRGGGAGADTSENITFPRAMYVVGNRMELKILSLELHADKKEHFNTTVPVCDHNFLLNMRTIGFYVLMSSNFDTISDEHFLSFINSTQF